MKTGVIEVTVKLYLQVDLDEEDARELVENVDYHFNSNMISHTEIIADDITDRCNLGNPD
jgi:DNA-dependent RNA polymerase auxiliary subunit epsilon